MLFGTSKAETKSPINRDETFSDEAQFHSEPDPKAATNAAAIYYYSIADQRSEDRLSGAPTTGAGAPAVGSHVGGSRRKRIAGPVTWTRLQGLAGSGVIDRYASLIWHQGMANWQTASEIPHLFHHVGPPPLPQDLEVGQPSLFAMLFRVTFNLVCLVLSIPLAILGGVLSASGKMLRVANLPRLSLLTHWFLVLLTQLATISVGSWLFFSGLGDPMIWDLGSFMYVPLFAFNFVLWVTLLHRCWTRLPAKYHTEDPRVMTLMMFVPVVNIYTMLRSIPRLDSGLHRLLEPGFEPPAFGRRWAWIGTFLSCIPFLNWIGCAILIAWLVSLRKEIVWLADKDIPAKTSRQASLAGAN